MRQSCHLFFCLCACLPTLRADPDTGALRLREIYVPHAEFHARAGDPRGVIMTLDEYRKLVLDAVRSPADPETVELPPVQAVVVSGNYHGVVADGAVRLQARLKIQVATAGWVRCDLGTPLTNLGSVQLDGSPAWVLIEEIAASTPRAYLVLQGQGDHEVLLSYTLAAPEHEELFTVEGALIPAATSRLELEVPGRVDARAEPPYLENIVAPAAAGDNSRLVLAAGSATSFRVEWRRRHTASENEAVLRAEHWITYAPALQGTSFHWNVFIWVARRKTEVLTLQEPAGATVVRIEGDLVHAWERTAAGLRVVLKEAALGELSLRLTGVVTAATERPVLGSPTLNGAFANTGYLAVREPRDAKLSLSGLTGVTEISSTDIGQPVKAPMRIFTFTTAGAQVQAALTPLPGRFESRAVHALRVGEDGLTLAATLRTAVLEGRIWRLELSLPPPWRVVSLEEVSHGSDGKPLHGLRHEILGAGADSRVRIELDRALSSAAPLEVALKLNGELFGPDRSWSRRQIETRLPQILGAERYHVDLGVLTDESMDALTGEASTWQAMNAEDAAASGLQRSALALTTRETLPSLSFTLVKRPPRGEYRLGSHVLALEDRLRVRADARLVLVDRRVEELIFVVPRDAGANAVIVGAGIKEITVDAATGRRTVRFAKPWLGDRQFRVEYESPLAARTSTQIPNVEILLPGNEGRLTSERLVVFQSRGPVEIEVTPGAGLMAAEVDETPAFAEPWSGGRAIAAHRFRGSGDPGSLRTTVHTRASVLKSLARELRLTTVLGHDGVSRTEAEILLAYSRQTHLALRLPDGARSLAVSVNGESARGVRPGTRREEIFVPLPPLSYATINIVYEEPDTSTASNTTADPLGAFGTWSAQALLLPEMPIVQTRWTIFHPEGYAFRSVGDAIRVENQSPVDDGYFASTFFGPLLDGRRPQLSFFQPPRSGHRTDLPVTLLEKLRLGVAAQQAVPIQGQLKAVEVQAQAQPAFAGTPLVLVWPEGRTLAVAKIGGGARLELAYHSVDLERFAQRTLFLGTVLAGLLFAWRRGARQCLAVAGLGLLVLTLAPLVLAWRSPLVVVPLCEGLMAIVLILLLTAPFTWLMRRRKALRLASLLLVGVFAANSSQAQAPPTDGVLIPYDPTAPGATSGDRVFLPRETFRKLWLLAHPEAPDQSPRVPVEAAFGTAEYALRIDGDSYRLSFRWRLKAFTNGWNAVPLLLDGKVVRLLVDGAEAGVAQAQNLQGKEQVPFVQIRGLGEHLIEGEITGTVTNALGVYSVRTRLLSLAGATTTFDLPPGARLQKPIATFERTQGSNRAVIDLGNRDHLEVEWTLPRVEGQSSSQVESRSLTLLAPSLDGYAVERQERIRVTGRSTSSLEYRILGNWHITNVRGTGITEWTVSNDAAPTGSQTLRIFFGQPISAAELQIDGRATTATTSQVASLALVDAARQETFVGLRHAALLRFSAPSLGGMRRASREETAVAFGLPPEIVLDRIYQAFGSAQGENIALDPVAGETEVASDLVVYLDANKAVLAARSRYTVKGPGPLRHEVPLPTGWTLRSVQGAGVDSWEILENPQRLSIKLSGRANNDTEITWTAERILTAMPDALAVPRTMILAPIGFSLKESLRWAMASSDELELSLGETGNLVPESVETANTWLGLPARASYRLALRAPRGEAAGAPAAFELRPVRRSSQLSASMLQVARLGEDAIHFNAHVELRIRLGARDRFRLGLPPGAVLESLETRNERSRETRDTPQGVEIDLVLQSPVSGEHGIDIVYRLQRSTVALPAILPLRLFDGDTRLGDVDQFVAVLQTHVALATAASSEQLVPVEAQSLPFLPGGIAPESLTPILRATGLDWSLTLDERLIEVTRSAAVVELAELTTTVGEDGTARTRVVYTVRNKGLQFLALELPMDSVLWGVTLGGRPVAVGGGDTGPGGERRIRVPLEHVGSGSLNLEVTVQYEERPLAVPAWSGEAELAAPRVLDTQVAETIWNVVFPGGYSLTRSGGNLREVPGSVLYAKRAENLLGQLDKISKAAGESDSVRVRDQAAQELSRLEQALGDNVAELVTSNRSQSEISQSARLGADDLQTQWSMNDQTIQRARTAQESLRQARTAREKQKGVKDAPSKEEQAFLDAANHLKRDWRDNARAPEPAEKSVSENAQQGKAHHLDYLLDPVLGARFSIDSGTSPTQEAEATSAPLPGDAKGLQPVPDLASAGLAPGVEAPVGKAPGNLFTFTNTGGDARVAFSFQRDDVAPRLASLATLLLVPVLLVAIARWRRTRYRRLQVGGLSS